MDGKPLTDLGGFRRDLLRAIEVLEDEDEPPSGADLQRYLREAYPDLNNGTLYPGISALVDAGYVERSAKNQRTNYLRLTEKARNELADHKEYYCNNE